MLYAMPVVLCWRAISVPFALNQTSTFFNLGGTGTWLAMVTTVTKLKRKIGNSVGKSFYRLLLVVGLIPLVIFVLRSFSYPSSCSAPGMMLISSSKREVEEYPTNLSHLAFGLQSSEKTYHSRKAYTEAWWRPNITRGYVYLDTAPTGDLLPWSLKSPQYRINDNLSTFLGEKKPKHPWIRPRIVHGILELFREEHQGLRWLIMGDDDTVFFVDNLVDVLTKYDHRKYYYLGYPSESVMANHFFNFNEAFGGGGIILSYPLAKALVNNMDRCFRKYSHLFSDMLTMTCLADIGANLTPHKGIHQNDLRGDYSGFLSSHPKQLVLSLHHWDYLDPIFPSMNRSQSIQNLMKAGNVDQSRLFQQTICHRRENNWSFSISWGYSVHIYENIMPRSLLIKPIETFSRITEHHKQKAEFMFTTRKPAFGDPCEAPHLFFFESIQKSSKNEILTVYSRKGPRNLPPCRASGNHSAEYVRKIHVLSPGNKRLEIDRAECCDVVRLEDAGKAEVRFRECKVNEIIA